jgi:hypothetical protein
MDICELHRKHLLQHWFYCCVRVMRALPRNGSTLLLVAYLLRALFTEPFPNNGSTCHDMKYDMCAYCGPMCLLFLSLSYGSFVWITVPKKNILSVRNKEPLLFEIGLPFSQILLFITFWLLFSIWIRAAYEIIIGINSQTRTQECTNYSRFYQQKKSMVLTSPVWRRGRIPPPWPCES